MCSSNIVHFVPNTTTLISTAALQWDEASDTDRHKHSNLGTGAGQGRIIMKEVFRFDRYQNGIILIK